MTYMLSKAPQGGNLYGYASAVAYIISVMVMLISLLLNRLSTDKSDPEYIEKNASKRQRKEMRKAAKVAKKEGGRT